MEKDAANDLSFLVALDRSHEESLGAIRHWEHLKIGFDDQLIWIKGFSRSEIESDELNRIPFVRRFTSRGGRLFPFNQLLPERVEPSLLWTPVERAIPVRKPRFNHNYFGLTEKVSVRLAQAEEEHPSTALITTIDQIEDYLNTAPKVRMDALKWVILDRRELLLIGKPLLPVPGRTLWNRGGLLLPSGFDLELPALARSIELKLIVDGKSYVVFTEDGNYFTLSKSLLQPLSLSSFRLSRSAPAPTVPSL